MRARGLAVLIAMSAPGGCDYFASPERLDSDVVSIAILLVAGERKAQLLAGHPLLDASHPPPSVEATLIGPGWQAAFALRTDPRNGCGGGPTDWEIPMVCLNAELPEPIREGVTYKLAGKGPKGSFTGETVVPTAPRILAPEDTVWLERSTGEFRVPVRYLAPPEVGTLRPEVFQTVDNGTGPRSRWIDVKPRGLDVDGWEATVVWEYTPWLQRASLHLFGIGRQYSDLRKLARTSTKRRGFGVTGEGVLGYFAGSAWSPPVEVRPRDAG